MCGFSSWRNALALVVLLAVTAAAQQGGVNEPPQFDPTNFSVSGTGLISLGPNVVQLGAGQVGANTDWRSAANGGVDFTGTNVFMAKGADGTLYGSDTTAKSLTLRPNSADLTSGLLKLQGAVDIYPGYADITGNKNVMNFGPTLSASATNFAHVLLRDGATYSPTHATDSGSALYTINFANSNATFTSATNGQAPFLPDTFADFHTVQQTANSGTTDYSDISFQGQQHLMANGGNLTLTGTVSNLNSGVYAAYSRPTLCATTGKTVAVDQVSGLVVLDALKQSFGTCTHAGTASIGSQVAVDVQNLTAGTNNISVRSAITAGTNKWFLLDTGGAASAVKGKVRLGDNTAPTDQLEFTAATVGGLTGVIGFPYDAVDFNNGLSALAILEVGATSWGTKTWTISTNSTGNLQGASNLFFKPTVKSAPINTNRTTGQWTGTDFQPQFKVDADSATACSGAQCVFTINVARAMQDIATFGRNASQGNLTVTELTEVYSQPSFNTGATATLRRGLWYRDKGGSGGVQNESVAVDVETQTVSGGNNIGLSMRSVGTAVEMRHVGAGIFGANATAAGASVGLEVQSTTKALLPSRMTRSQMTALTGVNGMIVYCSDCTSDCSAASSTGKLCGFVNSAWAAL